MEINWHVSHVRNDILGGGTITCYALGQSFHGHKLRIPWGWTSICTQHSSVIFPTTRETYGYWIKSQLLDCLKNPETCSFSFLNLPLNLPKCRDQWRYIENHIVFIFFVVFYKIQRKHCRNNQMKKLKSILQCICIKICCMKKKYAAC